MAKLLEFKKITKNYNSLKVLKDISLQVRKGEIVCLLGPSGSGKSTLFKLAAGLITPDKGQIRFAPDICKGFVFQEPHLLPWKTVAENIEFVQQNFLSDEKAQFIRDKLLELTGLGSFKDSYPHKLSGGMKQRVEIVRALSIQPDLLLMDEPFKSVDTQTKINLQEMVLRFWENKEIGIFLITHNPEAAVKMGDRIFILSEKPGKIIKEFKINKPQHKRGLGDSELYGIVEEITGIFMELVEGFRWEKNSDTDNILNNL